MSLLVTACRLRVVDLALRLPFRYGIATVTDLSHVFVEVDVIVAGQKVTGISAEHLSPKWLFKRPDTPPDHDNEELLESIRTTLERATGLAAPTPFALWQTLYAQQVVGPFPALWTHFPITLVERAVIDAFCRASGKPFHDLLRENAFGIDLGAVHPELARTQPSDWLPTTPRETLLLRHTVGMADPLTGSPIMGDGGGGDVLPRTLEDNIHTYGLKHFKLKIGGDPAADAARIREVLALCEAHAPSDWAFTLDANESYPDFATLRLFWEQLPAASLRRCLFVEQPLHRDNALTAAAGAGIAAWENHPPFLIDESDGAIGDFPRALELGYVGTSHKGCKGVFKGVANACLAKKRGAVLSGEDLTCTGPICLQQDLAVMAALGIESVERNGHHYFAGLSMFDEATQKAVLAAHPDLYHTTAAGWPTLTITEGMVALGSVNAAPFGTPLQ